MSFRDCENYTIFSCLMLTLSRSRAIEKIKRQIWQRKWTKTFYRLAHTPPNKPVVSVSSFYWFFFFSFSMYLSGTLSVAFLCGAAKTAAGLIAGFRAAQLVSRVVYVSFVRDIFSQLHLIYKNVITFHFQFLIFSSFQSNWIQKFLH